MRVRLPCHGGRSLTGRKGSEAYGHNRRPDKLGLPGFRKVLKVGNVEGR